MVNGEAYISGFTFLEGDEGFTRDEMLSYGIGGPLNVAVLFVIITGDSTQYGKIYSVQGLPPSPGFGNSGTLNSGNPSVSATCTYQRIASTTDGVERYSFTGGFSSQDFPLGFWNTPIRAIIPAGEADEEHISRELYIQYQCYEIADLPNETLLGECSPPNLSPTPTIPPDDEEGEITVTWTVSDPDIFPPDDGFIVERHSVSSGMWRAVGTVPRRLDIDPNYSFTEKLALTGDTETGEGTYKYRVRTYKLDDLDKGPVSDETSTTTFSPAAAPIPDIDITGSGTISFGGAPIMSFVGNPSGIYTLVPNKTHDTLYERGAVTSINIKIPDPTIKTGFI